MSFVFPEGEVTDSLPRGTLCGKLKKYLVAESFTKSLAQSFLCCSRERALRRTFAVASWIKIVFQPNESDDEARLH